MITLHLSSPEMKDFLKYNNRQHHSLEAFEAHCIALVQEKGEVLRPGFTWQLNGYVLTFTNK